MAKQQSLFPFTGRLGDLIGYERNGKYFVRRAPQTVRQTAATRRAAQRFGIASRKAALIRNAFYNDLDIRCDAGHINRLNKLLIGAGSNNAAVRGFRFNQYTGTDHFFTVAPELSTDGILHIPAQTIAQRKGVTGLEVKVIAVRINFMTDCITGTETAITMIDPRQPFAGADLALNVPGTGTLMIALQVRGMYKDQTSSNRQHLAADIIVVSAPQTPKAVNKHIYPNVIALQSEMALKCKSAKRISAKRISAYTSRSAGIGPHIQQRE